MTMGGIITADFMVIMLMKVKMFCKLHFVLLIQNILLVDAALTPI